MLEPLRKLARAMGIRRPLRLALEIRNTKDRQHLPAVLVITPDASRTDAPILALNFCQQLKAHYRVVTLLAGTGEFLDAFSDASDVVVGPYPSSGVDPILAERIIKALLPKISIEFAIVNSLDSRAFLRTLSECFVPSVFLVHEFYEDRCAEEEMVDAMAWAGTAVFATDFLRNNIQIDRLRELLPLTEILLPGRCDIAVALSADKADRTLLEIHRLVDAGAGPFFVVLGAGRVKARNGVDLFVATAAEIKKLRPDTKVRMVWIGNIAPTDLEYAHLVREQARQSRSEQIFTLLDESANLREIYELASVFFSSARLDSLPHTAIDAMSVCLPVLCFDRASGLPRLLETSPHAKNCVLPYLDTGKAAAEILKMCDDDAYRLRIGKETKAIADRNFDMGQYVAKLEALAKRQIRRTRQLKEDTIAIEAISSFTPEIFTTTESKVTRREAAHKFARFCQSNVFLRKPCPGFYPNRFKQHDPNSQSRGNPFIEFHKQGCPVGPWQIPVIDVSKIAIPSDRLRVAVHIHAYYPDLLKPLLAELKQQLPDCDLFFSAPQAIIGKEIVSVPAWQGRVVVKASPNRGRDIGPFLTLFARDFQNYDLIAHLHTKRSVHLGGGSVVAEWVAYLRENLVGGRYRAASRIIHAFESDPKLGLVFPDDPNIMGWDKNLSFASDIAKSMGLPALPDEPFPFPIGTMFWARPEALKPLFDLNLDWADYPDEPVLHDGSMLHALERLLPFVAEHAGYRIAVTYAPGIRR